MASGCSHATVVERARVLPLAAASLQVRAWNPLEMLCPELDLLRVIRVLEAAVLVLAVWEVLAPTDSVLLRPPSAEPAPCWIVLWAPATAWRLTILSFLVVGVEVLLADLDESVVELDTITPAVPNFRPVLYSHNDGHHMIVLFDAMIP